MSAYKVLIVEDEKPAREIIRQMVMQEERLFEVVGVAQNGRQGLEVYEKLNPHFVITDITMPIMGGMELLTEINQMDTQPQTIILSCHQDFHFAQQAIRLGAASYLLKDDCLADEQLLIRTMKELLPSVENKQHMNDKQALLETALRTNQIDLDRSCFLDILRGKEDSWQQLLTADPDLATATYSLIYAELDRSSIRFPIEETEELKIWQFAGVNVLQELLGVYGWTKTIALDRGRFISFCRCIDLPEKMPAVLVKAFQTYLKMNVYVHLCAPLSIGSSTEWTYLKALCKENHLFFYEPLQRVAYPGAAVEPRYRDIPAEEVSYWSQVIQDVFMQMQFSSEQPAQWQRFLTAAQAERWEPEQIKQLYRKACQQSLKWIDNVPTDTPVNWELDEVLQKVASVQTLHQVQPTIEQAMRGLRDALQRSNPVSAAMAQLLNRLENELPEHVSLEGLAREMDYSPPHFSFLFKKMTGLPLTQYIRNLRMNKAKLLLLHTNLKTFEIAERIGIENYRHFNKLFKQQFGMSPTEYRRTMEQ
ncbi:response regulator [Paenibacillus sp. GCM10027626]|uniref:response regulator transcription factor n=1 Tax=Paenibacillus sp. GCM10027626 TaxID=3273411 RepID=UPI00362B5782